jgi:Cytochrome c oxidase subunit Va
MGDLAGMDLVPEPTIVAAALRACRRINDYALSTRYRFLGFLSLIGFYAFLCILVEWRLSPVVRYSRVLGHQAVGRAVGTMEDILKTLLSHTRLNYN